MAVTTGPQTSTTPITSQSQKPIQSAKVDEKVTPADQIKKVGEPRVGGRSSHLRWYNAEVFLKLIGSSLGENRWCLVYVVYGFGYLACRLTVGKRKNEIGELLNQIIQNMCVAQKN